MLPTGAWYQLPPNPALPPCPTTLSLQQGVGRSGKGRWAVHSNVSSSQKFPKQAALISTKIKKLGQEGGEMPLLLICADLKVQAEINI